MPAPGPHIGATNSMHAHTSPWEPIAQFHASGAQHSVKITFTGNTGSGFSVFLCFLSKLHFLSRRCLGGFCIRTVSSPRSGQAEACPSDSQSQGPPPWTSKFSPELGHVKPDPERKWTHSRPPACHTTLSLPLFQNLWEDFTGVLKVVTGKGPRCTVCASTKT